jgi:hypothetical protein
VGEITHPRVPDLPEPVESGGKPAGNEPPVEKEMVVDMVPVSPGFEVSLVILYISIVARF